MRINLLCFRKSLGLNQSEMAEKLNMQVSQYSRVETGKTNPSFKTLEKFKEVFPEVTNVYELFENK